MNTFKKILLGISTFFTGLLAVSATSLVFEDFSFAAAFVAAAFIALFIYQIKSFKKMGANERLINDIKYESEYRKGRDRVRRAFDERINKLTDAEMKAELQASKQEEMSPEELQELLSDKTNQSATQKAE